MTATIIGATGLTGSYLLNQLLRDKYFDTIRILIRHPTEFTNPKLEKKLVDFTDNGSLQLALEGSDVIFCAIGTTQKKVKGDVAAYRKVDYDIPVKIAMLGKATGCETFVLISSVGANSKSNNYYLKLKGQVEDAIKEVGFKSVHVMQPSILLGDRKEFRLGEKMGKGFMLALSFLVPPKYKPIHAKAVAKAMLTASRKTVTGFFLYEYKAINKLNE
ncbi:MAG: NAD(P)H-binding protein [Chitinophagaceae bacterium]